MPACQQPSPTLSPAPRTNLRIEVMSLERYRDILHVCENMRDADREELFCTTDATTSLEYADRMAAALHHGSISGFVAYYGNSPIALLGVAHMWPGVVSVWMFATNGFPKIAIGLTKFVKHNMIPQYVSIAGVKRAQCFSQVGHTMAHAWLEVLGAKREGTAHGFGSNGEDFTLFAWRF